MIIFKEGLTRSEKYYEEKLGKERLRSLENVLRRLGNFDPKKDIKVVDEESLGNLDYMYEVTDLGDTSFKFYNFGLGMIEDDNNRYSKNFYLFMKRKNSNLVYVYDFFESKNYERDLKVIEINTQLSEHRVLRIKNNHRCLDYLILEENERRYVVSLKENAEENLLGNLERMIESFKQIEQLNLEEILKLIEMKEELLSTSIYVDDNLRASVKFRNGKISSYEIIDSNKTINTQIEETITRKVERTVPDSDEKMTTEETMKVDDKKIQSDMKRLFKQI